MKIMREQSESGIGGDSRLQMGDDADEDESLAIRNLYNITSNDNVEFWLNLLNLCEFKELNTAVEGGIHISEKRKLISIIYNEFLEALLKIVKKLDLTAVKMDAVSGGESDTAIVDSSSTALLNTDHSLGVSSNPASGLRPSKPRDFEILVNLVDFAK